MVVKVDNLHLSDGRIYSGFFDNDNQCPYGYGKCTYPNGNQAIGTFVDIPNGVSYINYDTFMQMGFFSQGKLQGWGMQMGAGDYRFGVFHCGKLINDCTVLMEEIHEHITEISRELRSKGNNVRWAHVFPGTKEIFFGISENGYKKIGIRFLPSGDVFIGASTRSLDITGTFLRLNGSRIESGQYERGTLIKETKGYLMHSLTWIELLHIDEISISAMDEYAFEVSKNTLEFIQTIL